MPIFGAASTPFDADVERVTDAKNTQEDWGLIMDLCDRVNTIRDGPRDCLKAIMKRLFNEDPHVVMQAIVLLDACVNNCGKPFRLEVASREFESNYRKLLSRSHPKIQDKLKALLKRWADGEFKSDPQYGLIPSMYHKLRKEGCDFHNLGDQPKKQKIPKDPNVVSSQQEEEDIAKAIQMSLQSAPGGSAGAPSAARKDPGSYSSGGGNSGGGSLYGNLANMAPASSNNGGKDDMQGFKEPKKARALYDFEAAEDNELTFKAGELVIIVDNSDANWWKGSNHRGEGLFPANFVTLDLEDKKKKKEKKKERRRSVQFNEEVEIKAVEDDGGAAAAAAGDQMVLQQPIIQATEISEAKLDQLLDVLHNADPITDEQDPPDLNAREQEANTMGPLIDAELEQVDRRLAQLTRLSTELVDSLNMYHQLMRDIPPSSPYGGAPGGYPAGPQSMVGYPPMYQAQPPSYNPGPPQQQQQAPQPPQQAPPATQPQQVPPQQQMWPQQHQAMYQQQHPSMSAYPPPQQQGGGVPPPHPTVAQNGAPPPQNGGAPPPPPQQQTVVSQTQQMPPPQTQQSQQPPRYEGYPPMQNGYAAYAPPPHHGMMGHAPPSMVQQGPQPTLADGPPSSAAE